MPIKKVKVSQLPKATTTDGLKVLGVDIQNQSVQAEMELLRGNKGETAYELWLLEPGNKGKTFEEYIAFNRQPATDAANELRQYQIEVTGELNQLANETEEAKVAAANAAQRANEIAGNPTKVGEDNYVYIYNESTKAYEKTDINVKGDSAYQLWIQEPENAGKTYTDYLAYNQLPATEAANRLDQYQSQVTGELTQLANETTQAKNETVQATLRANEIADHPTKIGEDNYVYKYNEQTKEYEKTDIYVKGEKGDKGNLLYASFEVDIDTGELVMITPDDYNGPSFHLSEAGDLVVTING